MRPRAGQPVHGGRSSSNSMPAPAARPDRALPLPFADARRQARGASPEKVPIQSRFSALHPGMACDRLAAFGQSNGPIRSHARPRLRLACRPAQPRSDPPSPIFQARRRGRRGRRMPPPSTCWWAARRLVRLTSSRSARAATRLRATYEGLHRSTPIPELFRTPRVSGSSGGGGRGGQPRRWTHQAHSGHCDSERRPETGGHPHSQG
jgi:hypothetical protein